MNNFEAKEDRNDINDTFYLVPCRMNPPDRYGQALGLEPSGKCLTVKIQKRISFLKEEMNFQIKSCQSLVPNIFETAVGIASLACLSTCLFAPYFLNAWFEHLLCELL